MKIIKQDIELCAKCDNYHGFVKEEYNGHVPVYCVCDLEEEKNKNGSWGNPCMICPDGDEFYWTPISSHKEKDGHWWHTPYFAGPKMN